MTDMNKVIVNGVDVGAELARLRAGVDSRDKELERTRAWIEERAGELHVILHSSAGREDRFWGCTRGACPQFAAFLRGLVRFRCKAREAGSAGGNDPQDCDWPWCGCYPEATKVLEAVEESGRFVERAQADRLRQENAGLRALLERYWEWQATCQELLPDDMVDATLAALGRPAGEENGQ